MAGMSRTQSYSSDSGGGGGGGSPAGSPGSSSSRRRGKTYMCKVCGHEFASGQSLGGHMNVHRREQRSPRSSQSELQPGDTHHDYKGVRYRREQNKWVAEIRPPKASRTWWLGTYSTAREAAYAYDVAITYFRSETALNFSGHPVYDQIPQIDTDLPNQEFAAQLRKVVKKYGKMAMESGAGPSASSQQEFSWDDFTTSPPPPLEQNDYNHFNVEDLMPQPDPPEHQGHVHDAQASSYYGYQHQYGWSPDNPRGY